MQQETQWRLLIQIRINQIFKTEFLLQYSLNLNGFHIITADQSYVLLSLAVLFIGICVDLASFSYQFFTNTNTLTMTI